MSVDALSAAGYKRHLDALGHDLLSACEYNSYPSQRIESLLAVIDGERDTTDWHWIVRLVDGRFAYITGGCDYIGWDCQSSLDIFEEDTIDASMRQVGEAERDELAAQLARAKAGTK